MALDRLDALRRSGAEVLQTLRPGASDEELARLRRAVEPYELPTDLEALFAWADGQRGTLPWQPLNVGPLMPAKQVAELYQWMKSVMPQERYHPTWLPISALGPTYIAVDLCLGVVLDHAGDSDIRVVAPCLAAALEATGDMIDAALPWEPPPGAEYVEWYKHRGAILEAASGRVGWQSWPYDRSILLDPEAWPPEWRRTAGLPPHSEAESRPITRVADAPHHADLITVEGTIVAQSVPRGDAAPAGRLIELADSTAALSIFVGRDVPGRHLAGGLPPWRLQVDVRIEPPTPPHLTESVGEGTAPQASALAVRPAPQRRH